MSRSHLIDKLLVAALAFGSGLLAGLVLAEALRS